MKLRLEVTSALNSSSVFEHAGPTVVIGRDPRCELSLQGEMSQGVSWAHARIDLTPKGIYLTDLESTNGTFINDRRITGRGPLRVGDHIRLGQSGPYLRVVEADLGQPSPGGAASLFSGQPEADASTRDAPGAAPPGTLPLLVRRKASPNSDITPPVPAPPPLLSRSAETLPPSPAPTAEDDYPTLTTPGDQLPAAPVTGGMVVPGYEILGEVDRGGMGVVYKARQLLPDRIVALKMILAGPFAGAVHRERFRREAEAITRLQHPHIVQIYDFGEHDGLPYFAMEYVEGGTLERRATGAPLPAREAARFVHALAGAVHYAHQNRIIHRDLKPANVLLTAAGNPKITDFGLAKHLDGGAALTPSMALLGSPSYMSPEQAEGETRKIGPPADIYGLGAILYRLLTGRPPFRGPTVLETLEQVRSQQPLPPTALQPQVPPELEAICLTCLQKAVDRRYASAAVLAQALQRFLGKA